MNLTVGVSIATRNRQQDLARTLEVLEKLQPQPAEVRITADGCTDGTIEFLRSKYPQIILTINDQPLGSTASRDLMFRAATTDLILILDDDSYPLEEDALSRIVSLFQSRPRMAVATFPQKSDEFPETLTQSHFGEPHFAGTYVNCATAIRRSAFVELGGYFHPFRIAYDEPDFALRCVAAGWEVRFETAVTIRHHYSGAQRNELRMHLTHARNEVWSVFLRCPAPQCFGIAAFRLVRQFCYAATRGWSWVFKEPIWWMAVIAGLREVLQTRKPIAWRRYRAWMQLVRNPITSQSEWDRTFRAP